MLPETHPPATVLQVCPCLLLQAPDASHVPAQRPLGSCSLLAATQVWLAESHVIQVPVQSLFVQQPAVGIQVVVPLTVQDFVVVAGQL